jgi:hypothetical protein
MVVVEHFPDVTEYAYDGTFLIDPDDDYSVTRFIAEDRDA